MARVTLGIVGLGRGMAHLRNALRLEQAELVGACDWYEPRRRRAAEVLHENGTSIQLLEEFDELLALKPDALVIASNGKIQCEHVRRTMEAGCHVLSEVPGAYTADEWVAVRDAVERTGRTYMLAENSSFLDFLRHWRAWLLQGDLGPISIAEAEYLHYLPATLEFPDGSRLSPSRAKAQGRTDGRPIWRADQPPIQYLTHDLGPLLEVLDDRVVSVSCRGAPWWCAETPLRSDGQIALFTTAKGTLVKIMVTLSTRQPSAHRYRILGVDGTAEWFSHEGYCRRLTRDREEKEGWERIDIGTAAPDADSSTGHGGCDLNMLRAFVEAVANGRPSPIDVYRAIEYSLPGIIANASAEAGGAPMEVPNLRRAPFAGTHFWDVVGLP